jgi:PPM family protein phosphatase
MLPELEAVPIQVAICGRTHPGRIRSDNQDTFLAVELADGGTSPSTLSGDDNGTAIPLERSFKLGAHGALLMVADGMGGAAGGATASHLAVATVLEAIGASVPAAGAEPAEFAERLRHAVESANLRIQQMAAVRPDLQGMGTTFTGAGILGARAVLAQVGDSRAYLLRDDRLVQLTRDQSMVQELIDAGVLTPEGARTSPQRNVILQALGASPELKVVLSEEDLCRGDLLLLCSDGLCGVVEDDEIARILTAASTLPEACANLVEEANDRGGPDNITVLLARVDGPGLQPAAERNATRCFRVPTAEQ